MPRTIVVLLLLPLKRRLQIKQNLKVTVTLTGLHVRSDVMLFIFFLTIINDADRWCYWCYRVVM